MAGTEKTAKRKRKPRAAAAAPTLAIETPPAPSVDGVIKLATTDLDKVGKDLKQVRKEIAALRKQEDQLKQLILSNNLSKPGYANASIEIVGKEKLDTEDPELLVALAKAKSLGAACNMTLSDPKIRALAVSNPDIATAYLAALMPARTIKVVK